METKRKKLLKKIKKTELPANIALSAGAIVMGGGLINSLIGWFIENPALINSGLAVAAPGLVACLSGGIASSIVRDEKKELNSLKISAEERRLIEIVKKGNIFDKKKALDSLRDLGFTEDDIQKHTRLSEETIYIIDTSSTVFDLRNDSQSLASEEDAYNELDENEKELFDSLKSQLLSLKAYKIEADIVLEFELGALEYDKNLTRVSAEQYRRNINSATEVYEKCYLEYVKVLDELNRLIKIGKERYTSRVITDNLILKNSKKLI